MKYFRKVLILVITAFLFFSIPEPTVGQKKNRNEENPGNKKDLPEKNPRQAEAYFMEGTKFFILEDFAKAMPLFQKALELDPENAAIHYKIAEIYLKNNESDKALPHAREALNLDPNNKYYYLLLSDLYTKKSEFNQAAETYERMIGQIPDTEEYLFDLAAIYLYQKEFDKAIKCYDRIEEKYGINEQVCLQRKDIYKRQGKMDKVIAEGNKLMEAFPDDPEYVILQANTLLANDLNDQAITLLENHITRYPNNGTLLLLLSESYRNKGEQNKSREYVMLAFDNADLNLQSRLQYIVALLERPVDDQLKAFIFELADQTIRFYPEEAESYAIYGDALLKFDSINGAKKMYLKSLEYNEGNFQAWQNIINIELNNNELDSVAFHAEKALELFPNQSILYFYLGTSLLLKKDYQRSADILEQGKKFSTSNLEMVSWFNAQLGDIYYYLNDYEKSDIAYEAVLDYDPDNDHVLNNYSYFLSLRKQKLDLALKMSTRLIKKNPDNATYLDTHAWVLYVNGEYLEAKKYIEKALMQKENISGTIVEHYGDILYQLGETDEAIQQWKRAKQLGDEHSEFIDQKIADGKLYE